MGQSYRKTESLSESYHLPLGAAPPYLCLLRRNFCAAGGVLLWLQRCDFRTAKKPSPLTTAAQNIHVFLRKSPLLKEHFFELLKTAISSNACGTSTLKSPPPWAFSVPDVHQRVRKHLARCTLDCGFKTLESPALRGFVGGLRALATAALYLVIFSNGPYRSKNLPEKFGFSPKTVPANIAQKLPPQRCPQPLLIPIFNFSHKWPTFALTPESGYTHSVFGERSHTAAYTPKQGPSFPRPQCGFVPPAKYLIFRHAFIYIHFPVLCEPSPSAEGENPAKLPPRLYLKPFFNFPHKWPTFAFTGESGYTFGFRRKIAHSGSHGETRGVSDGGGITTLGAFRTFANLPGPGVSTANFAAFGSWPGVLQKNAESLRNSDALMRVAVPRRRGPAGLRDLSATW